MPVIFRKWWVILLQGILLIILGFYFLGNPMETLGAVSFWVALLTLAVGGMGVFGYFTVPKEEREGSMLWWSLATLVLGILMITNLGAIMKMITTLFGIWMLLTGYWLTTSGWSGRKDGSMGWLMVIGGVLSMIAGVTIIFNLGAGAVGISTLLGLQTLVAGVAIVALSLVKKRAVGKVKDKLEGMRG